MTVQEQPGGTPGGFDPEAEQEVDFSRYARLLAARWWVLAAGLVAGAIVGYAVSLGGSQVYKATATVYLGQPYSASGSIQLQSLQTNPSTVRTIVQSEAVIVQVAQRCKAKPSQFRNGISTQAIGGNIAKSGQTPEVSISVQSPKRKVASCAANGLAAAVVDRTSAYADRKIANFRDRIAVDDRQIALINEALQHGGLSVSDQLLLQIRLDSAEQDRLSVSQLLQQAMLVEKPSLVTPAHSSRVTARSRRNTVVVAALIGLVLGALVALVWDRLAPRLAQRAGE
ncbi:MAG: hypothetical protein IRZ20_09215 [Thermoleophilia bacterium]|nr:hypothetical protein [Thermoleophilia bacterium]